MTMKPSVRSRVAALACLAVSVFAILIWGRLKLVTGVPRTAFADPEQEKAKAARPDPPPFRPHPRPAARPETPPPPPSRPDLTGD